MPVTELALLRTKSHLPPDNTTISHLYEVQSSQSTFSSHPEHLFAQVEDPSYIYLISEWDSVEQHYSEWIPSSTNQVLLDLLKDEIEVVWMFHVDNGRVEVGLGLNAPAVAVGRYFVKKDVEGEFESVFNGSKHHLGEFTEKKFGLFSGWRVEKGVKGKRVGSLCC